MSLITITQPAIEPVSVADIKAAARIDDASLDAQIAMLIPAFRLGAEHILGRRLITQTAELVIDAFPTDTDIDLMLPNVQSITSVKYLDSSRVEQTLDVSEYSLDFESAPCWLLATDAWPTAGDYANAVRVRYVVGYGASASDVPGDIRLWITAHVCQALDNPTALDGASVRTLPYLDRLLDAGTIWRCG
jgi:uncharacterized phiE125 gp8 family phage protein